MSKITFDESQARGMAENQIAGILQGNGLFTKSTLLCASAGTAILVERMNHTTH